MQIRFGNRRRIQFTDKTHPVTGIISVIIGILSLLSLLALFLFSSSVKGNSGITAGFLGILVLAASVIGFVMAAKCYKKEDIYMATPAAGTVLNGLLIVACMILYVMGAV